MWQKMTCFWLSQTHNWRLFVCDWLHSHIKQRFQPGVKMPRKRNVSEIYPFCQWFYNSNNNNKTCYFLYIFSLDKSLWLSKPGDKIYAIRHFLFTLCEKCCDKKITSSKNVWCAIYSNNRQDFGPMGFHRGRGLRSTRTHARV